MYNNRFDAAKALRVTRIIYFSLLSGIVFLAIIALSITNSYFKSDLTDPLFIVLFILTFSSPITGYLISNTVFKKSLQQPDLASKYPLYQSGLLIGLATCEGPSIFAVVLLLITSNLLALIFLGISLCFFIYYFPTPAKIAVLLNLTEAETEQFYNQQ
jgi:hypothetical protein